MPPVIVGQPFHLTLDLRVAGGTKLTIAFPHVSRLYLSIAYVLFTRKMASRNLPSGLARAIARIIGQDAEVLHVIMNLAAKLSSQTQRVLTSVTEQDLVARLIQSVQAGGATMDTISAVNFYVALKSKPLTILTGPAQSGKVALVESLAHLLTGGEYGQCQMLIGHPPWATQNPQAAFFEEVHKRWNSSKIFALIEEAWQPENADKVFHACLARITLAELTSFFSEVASQLRRGHIIRLPSIHLTKPVPFPPNLSLIGTMDTVRFDGWDADLLSMATIIQWPDVQVELDTDYHPPSPVAGAESEFLRSRIRTECTARRKLHRIMGWRLQVLQPLYQIAGLLRGYAVRLPRSVIGEAIVYVANAWSRQGIGLFDPATPRNAAIALDLAIAQTILPRITDVLRQSAVVRGQLREMLKEHSPHSLTFMGNLA
jgi:hypothetical protein